jgi:hypothetical protein
VENGKSKLKLEDGNWKLEIGRALAISVFNFQFLISRFRLNLLGRRNTL